MFLAVCLLACKRTRKKAYTTHAHQAFARVEWNSNEHTQINVFSYIVTDACQSCVQCRLLDHGCAKWMMLNVHVNFSAGCKLTDVNVLYVMLIVLCAWNQSQFHTHRTWTIGLCYHCHHHQLCCSFAHFASKRNSNFVPNVLKAFWCEHCFALIIFNPH